MSLIGQIHSTESFGTVDGPGIRFIAFMQGCLMRCQYCHNRDSWALDEGTSISSAELTQQVLQYRHFYENGGGFTASGGEAILQAEFLAEVFSNLKSQGIHTCLDTNGFVRKHSQGIDDLLDNTDLVMLDIKHIDDQAHIALTHVSNQRTLQFAQYLQQRNQKTWIRYVVVPGHTDKVEDAEKLAEFIKPMTNVEKVELLPYHKLGAHKWQTLGQKYPLEGVEPPTIEVMEQIKNVFKNNGILAQY
ncbi:pyruvate formate lyase 1-activating protein [Paraferrimonas sp. SM1919]|uniref:pyruvate formate lyase 1-activating protein n=1 Tax=Paraferrimonas sp. SM1919 TaxID=2662263 RepID=UPI0013D204EF|nr:pyruvate formate lyase 1-activating protein [Paraferrimonas sp. SM1919]